MEVAYSEQAIKDILFWKKCGQLKTKERISRIIEDIQLHPFSGMGKPEALKGDLSGKWSRRLTDADRIVYSVLGNIIHIHSLRGHYLDK